jgi:hypothetical protein
MAADEIGLGARRRARLRYLTNRDLGDRPVLRGLGQDAESGGRAEQVSTTPAELVVRLRCAAKSIVRGGGGALATRSIQADGPFSGRLELRRVAGHV